MLQISIQNIVDIQQKPVKMIVFARQIKKKKKEDCSEKNKNEMIMNTANICSEYCWYAAKTCKNDSHCRKKKKERRRLSVVL